MKRVTCLLAVGLVLLLGSFTIASAGSDFTFFDGTNPTSEAPPFGGAECALGGTVPAGTLHATVSAHSSGPDGFVRLTYRDGDWVQFPITSGGVLNITQAVGAGAARRVRLSNGNDQNGARLVGSMSVITIRR
ncbi:MAG: hypothetical protein ACRDGN_18260 [bacterium]